MRLHEISEPQSRKDLHFKDVTKRIPELTAAAQKVHNGTMSNAEYAALVNQYKKVEPYETIPEPASYNDMFNALDASKRDKLLKPAHNKKYNPNQSDMFNDREIADGTNVRLRLDIPAYSKAGVWVPTVHDKSGSSTIAHNSVAMITDVQMVLPEKGALNIARKHTDKTPIATLKGNWVNITPGTAKKMAQKLLSDPEWIQVGMDPERHAYFYDRTNQEPVLAGDVALQIGGLVLVKNPQYGNKDDYKYE